MKRKIVSSSNTNGLKQKRRIIKEASIPLKSLYVDISNSNISSFNFLKRLQKILTLNAKNTLITDFSNAPFCSSLRQIQIQYSPIAKESFYRLMILIVINPDIEYIDNQKVIKEERDKSLSLHPLVCPKLIEGFILTSLDPITLCKGDETVVFNSNDAKKTNSINKNEIKMKQTVQMIDRLSDDINKASGMLGIDQKHSKPVNDINIQKSIKTSKFIGTKSKISNNVQSQNKRSNFPMKENKKSTGVLSEIKERNNQQYSSIINKFPSRSKNQIKQNSQIRIQNRKLDDTILTKHSCDLQNIQEKEEVTVEKNFEKATDVIMSPKKVTNCFESYSSESSNSYQQMNRKIICNINNANFSKNFVEEVPINIFEQDKIGYSSLSEAYDYNLSSFDDDQDIQLSYSQNES